MKLKLRRQKSAVQDKPVPFPIAGCIPFFQDYPNTESGILFSKTQELPTEYNSDEFVRNNSLRVMGVSLLV